MSNERSQHRFEFPPVRDGRRPLWSVMIPTHNCARYLRETLASVLNQDPGPDVMQIEVVDDHSIQDDPEAVVAELGAGRVGFFRQPANIGHIRNFDTCVLRSRGSLVHLLHGDDAVRPGFYLRMREAFEAEPSIGAAFCRQIFIDENGESRGISPLEQETRGVLTDWLERLAEEQRIMTPSIVVRREAYEAVGGFDDRLTCSEDWEMWVRIASRYPIWYEPEPLAVYRMHGDSNTGRNVRSGEDIISTHRAIETFVRYLPPEIRRRVYRKASRTYAHSAIGRAHQMRLTGDASAARAQARAALVCSRSPEVIARVAWLLVKLGLGAVHGTDSPEAQRGLRR